MTYDVMPWLLETETQWQRGNLHRCAPRLNAPLPRFEGRTGLPTLTIHATSTDEAKRAAARRLDLPHRDIVYDVFEVETAN